jgi:hypothetical protein
MPLWSAKRSSALPSTDPPAPVAAAAATTPATSDPWSAVRYDPRKARLAHRGHIESWFLKANDRDARRAIWLKWTIWASDRAPDRALAETWAVAFGGATGHVATKTSVPFEQARFAAGGLGATIDGCRLFEGGAQGRVESGGRAIAYDLRIESREPPLVHLPASWMYAPSFPAQKIVSPMPDLRVTGTATVQGETWTLDAWPGMLGHNWGHAHAAPYAWGHCSAWDGGEDGVVLEGFTARARALPIPPVTALVLRYQGKRHALNGFASIARNAGDMSPRRWSFRGLGRRIEVAGELWADTDDYVGLFYPNPDGSDCYCLNTTLARAEVTLSIAGQPSKTLRSERAALELATRDPHHGVRMYV